VWIDFRTGVRFPPPPPKRKDRFRAVLFFFKGGIEPKDEAANKISRWDIFRPRALRVYRAMQQGFAAQRLVVPRLHQKGKTALGRSYSFLRGESNRRTRPQIKYPGGIFLGREHCESTEQCSKALLRKDLSSPRLHHPFSRKVGNNRIPADW